MKMMQIQRKFLASLISTLVILGVSSVAASADVSFSDNQHVKLGYATVTPPVWEVKALPAIGTEQGKILFLGSALLTGDSYGSTSEWNASNVRQFLNETFLTTHFSKDELEAGVLTPYGNNPIYNVVVSETPHAEMTSNVLAPNVTIPPSSAGDSLVWILDVQEMQGIFNDLPNLPWNDTTGYPARLAYASGGPYRTRSVDPLDQLLIWTLNPDGSFSRDPISASPSYVRPVVSPDVSVMLYKRGAGTQSDPFSVCYRWNTSPVVSGTVNSNTITLTFPEAVKNNGQWPGAEAWKITDDLGTTYSVTGTSATDNNVTLTVFPVLRKDVALTLEYVQRFDDGAQGLNNTKGAILKNSGMPLLFGLSDVTLTASVEDESEDGGGDNNAGGCNCEQSGDPNDGNCTCTEGAGTCNCGAAGCDRSDGLRVLSDSVHYLVLGQPFVLDLEADGGVVPYAWSTKNGFLPDGLILSEEGAIEGETGAAGSFRVSIEVTDSDGKAASKRFSFIVVEDEELAIMTDTLPEAQVGQFYTARVRSCGGVKPYVWEVESLPDWLSFDASSGSLSGTPPESGIHDLMVKIRDGEETTDSKLLRLSVYPRDGLLIATRALPAAIQGKDYSAQLEASGGIAPYFFTLRRASPLPPGLTLDSSGMLYGRASQNGVYSFVIDAADGNNLQGNASYTMVVLDEKNLNLDVGDFMIREDENGKRIHLSFYLPVDFNNAEVVAVDSLVSPDEYITGSSSLLTHGVNNEHKVDLTLYVSESVLENRGSNWKTLIQDLTFEGFIVRFRDASAEEARFEEPLPLEEMKRETEDEGDDSGSGGCNAGWSILLSIPFISTVLFKIKSERERKK
jgi:hypothetical protein